MFNEESWLVFYENVIQELSNFFKINSLS